MKYAPYSASKIAVFNQCKRKFQYKYIDKIKTPFEPSVALTKGNIVHSFLEHHELPLADKITKIKKEKQIANSPYFTKELVKECIGIYNSYLETSQGQENFSNKTLGNELKIALNKKLEPCEYYGSDVLFRGFIDRISVDTNTDIVYIKDYKTGKNKSEGPYKLTFDQLMYYSAWYFAKFPVDKIIIEYDFVEHTHEPYMKELTRENVVKYKKFLVQSITTIEKCDSWDKNNTPLCSYCDYQVHCQNDNYIGMNNGVPEIEIDEDEIPF